MPEVEATGMLGAAPATHEALELFYEHLQDTLIEIDFFGSRKAAAFNGALKTYFWPQPAEKV